MTSVSPPPGGLSLDGIEVVELWEIDLDFAVEEAFRQGTPPIIESTHTEPAKPDELTKLELFRGVGMQDLGVCAAGCQSIHAVPGYVLLAPGRLNTKVFFVLDGQLRVYAPTNDKRPMAVVDVGHSTGLRPALVGQPANHAVVATEVSHILAIDRNALDECAKRSHPMARNYAALLESYIRGDNCLQVGAHAGGAARQGQVDELTLLHNQHWLDTVFPRLLGRYRLGGKSLAVTAFAIDKLDAIIKEHGIAVGLRVLQAIGHWILDHTRPTDILAISKNRHIFAFLPECDLAAARQLGGRLKTLIQSVPIALAPGQPSAPITLTLSLGAAEFETGMKENEFLDKIEALIEKSITLGGNWLSDKL